MHVSLIPDMMVEKITDLTPAYLEKSNIHFLMLDFDNTILPYTSDQLPAETEQWISEMKNSGTGLCVVSNSRKGRVPEFCRMREIPCIMRAGKPFGSGIRKCCRQFKLIPEQTALVGDQIYTDVLGANLANVRSVLVTPIHLHNIWLRLRHAAELPFIAIGRRKIK